MVDFIACTLEIRDQRCRHEAQRLTQRFCRRAAQRGTDASVNWAKVKMPRLKVGNQCARACQNCFDRVSMRVEWALRDGRQRSCIDAKTHPFVCLQSGPIEAKSMRDGFRQARRIEIRESRYCANKVNEWIARWNLTEYMQPVADLRGAKFAQIPIDIFEQMRKISTGHIGE